MVCLGNICRSPLAQGIFEHYAQAHSITIDSAGTANYHKGNGPDPRSIKTAAAHGIDITNQTARQFTVADFKKFDYIYAMDRENLNHILRLAQSKEDAAKVSLLLETEEVEDPYYGGDQGFEVVFNKIADACKKIINSWHR